jgi:hypothetical protein
MMYAQVVRMAIVTHDSICINGVECISVNSPSYALFYVRIGSWQAVVDTVMNLHI